MFSLDDFGSGMSSYAYLKNLPVDFLKIDGTFVKNMDENPYDYAVVKSIAEIGHFMGKKIIAEYVETPRILDMLREIGVDYAQGYAIARPRNLIDSDVLAHSPAA
jgi:EAL domain-containing protein (putative c-di-GMP-specific phosphodiesterase class I)